MKPTLMKCIVPAILAAVSALPGYAGSNPLDPDCPMTAQFRKLARQVDVINQTCYGAGELCDALRAGIEDTVSAMPASPLIETSGGFAFDPDTVFKMMDYDGFVYDCDPEDEDCDGRTLSPGSLARQGFDEHEIGGILQLFPVTNLPSNWR